MTIISPLARRNRNQGQIEKASLRKEPVEFAIFNHNNHPGHRCRHNHYHHHPRPQIMIMRWLLNVRNRLVIGHGGDLLWYNGRLPLRVVKQRAALWNWWQANCFDISQEFTTFPSLTLESLFAVAGVTETHRIGRLSSSSSPPRTTGSGGSTFKFVEPLTGQLQKS